MKNIWKRSLSLFLALVMVFGMLPVNALADELNTEETQPAETMVETTEAPAETTEVTEAPAEETVEETAVSEATDATEAEETTEAPKQRRKK